MLFISYLQPRRKSVAVKTYSSSNFACKSNDTAIMDVAKVKKEKTPKKVKADVDADGETDYMIQPEQVAPRIDTSKYVE